MADKGHALQLVRQQLADRYGISVEELMERQEIPLAERTALNRDELVRLQKALRRRLDGTLGEQTAARMPLYRLRAKAAQHIDAAAAPNWGIDCVRELLNSEVEIMQADFEATLKAQETARREKAIQGDAKRSQERAAALNKMRAAINARFAAQALMNKAKVGAYNPNRAGGASSVQAGNKRRSGAPNKRRSGGKRGSVVQEPGAAPGLSSRQSAGRRSVSASRDDIPRISESASGASPEQARLSSR